MISMMFGLEQLDFLGEFILNSVQPSPAATEKDAIPRVFRKYRRVCFSAMNGSSNV